MSALIKSGHYLKMNVNIVSNASAFLSALERDLNKLGGQGVTGSIENHKEYANYVNFGTSRQQGQHFIENSVPGIQTILQEEYSKIKGMPTDEDMLNAHDRVLRRGLMEEIIPRTPRSTIDHVHMQDDYEIHTSEII